jgi:hypothetical protein
MAKKSADQIVAKYQSGVAGAGQAYADGVQNPSRSWAQATAAGAERWKAGLQAAMQNNAFQRGVQAAGDSKWQTNAVAKGAQNYSSAAATAAAAYQQQASKIMSAAQAAQSAVSGMPDTTFEQRVARSAAAQRAISAAWKK